MYIIVLATATIVTVIGLAALLSVRIERREAELSSDHARARLYAQSAVELAIQRIADDANWRTNNPSGIWEADRPIGGGTYSIQGVDPADGDLTNSGADPLTLTGIGVQGDARYKLQLTLNAVAAPFTCLEVSWHSGGDTLFDTSSTLLRGDQIISSNNTVQTSSSVNVYADVEAVNSISGGGYQQLTTNGITPRTMPDPATVFDYYLANGTAIGIGALPVQSGTSVLESVLLSPASNPFGLPNAQGIYVIDCLNQPIKIQNCRIVGTIVLLNPGATSGAYQSINWAPEVSYYPALLVQGNFEFGHSRSALLAESTLGVNFNPVGTPYAGQEDALNDDQYPTIVKGLVYVSGDISTTLDPEFDGVVISGTTTTHGSDLLLTYSAIPFNTPPPGFAAAYSMQVSQGSWRRVVD